MKVRVADERKYAEVIIREELMGTPLAGQEALFIKYGDKYKVDPLLAVAISYHESRHCKSYVSWYNQKYHNCGGIMADSQKRILVAYPNWEAFIADFTRLLAVYIYHNGKDTIHEIGVRYAPTKAAYINRSWNGQVTRKYKELWNRLK